MAGEALTQEQRRHLSDMALLDHARAAAKIEHQAMTEVIETIREVNRRKLFLKLNYTSLFDYVRKDLGYEGGTAQSRIDVARLFEEVPSVKADFESGQLKITQVSVFSQSVKQKMREEPGFKLQPEAKAEILEAVKQLDVKQTQRFVAEKLDLKIKDFEKARVQSDDSVRLEITLTKDQMADLERIKDLISHQYPTANWSQIIGIIAKEYRKRKDPLVYEEQRKKKRQGEGRNKKQSQNQNQRQKQAGIESPASDLVRSTSQDASVKLSESVDSRLVVRPEVNAAKATTDSASSSSFGSEVQMQASMVLEVADDSVAVDDSRFGSEVPWLCTQRRTRVPERIRRIVIKRDKCCQWVNCKTGEICESTFQLEVDHKTSRWAGGTDDIENLHALCDHHNRLKYQREAGITWG